MRRLAALAGVLGLAACSQSPLVEPGEREPDKRVRDIFISDTFPKVFPDTRIKDAAKRFVNTEWIALPVVSRLDAGRVVGVVTLHDITRQQFLQETKGG